MTDHKTFWREFEPIWRQQVRNPALPELPQPANENLHYRLFSIQPGARGVRVSASNVRRATNIQIELYGDFHVERLEHLRLAQGALLEGRLGPGLEWFPNEKPHQRSYVRIRHDNLHGTIDDLNTWPERKKWFAERLPAWIHYANEAASL
jgi:hypothetical protein